MRVFSSSISRLLFWFIGMPLVVWMPLSSCNPASNASETISWQTMAKAQKLAEQHNKMIIVNVYTDWCKWCKKLDKEVYTDARVTKVIDDYFYMVRLNAESEEPIVFNGQKLTMAQFAQLLGVTTYPGTVFVDAKGNTIGKQTGYMEVEVFEKLLAYVGSNAYRTMQFDEFSMNSLSQNKTQ